MKPNASDRAVNAIPAIGDIRSYGKGVDVSFTIAERADTASMPTVYPISLMDSSPRKAKIAIDGSLASNGQTGIEFWS